jgi:hypothetical protein
MKVSIERKRPTINKLFGGTKEADYESALVTIQLSEEEKQIIKQNRLDDRMVYEHPEDESDYEAGQETAASHPNSYAGKHPAPRYKRSRFIATFSVSQLRKFTLTSTPRCGLLRYSRLSRTIYEN